MKLKAHSFWAEPYGVEIHVIFSDDVVKARDSYASILGEDPGPKTYTALLNSAGNDYYLFFSNRVSLRQVAHEVFHLTHRIADWVSLNFDSEHHEQCAYLHDYLMYEVVKRVPKRAKMDKIRWPIER